MNMKLSIIIFVLTLNDIISEVLQFPNNGLERVENILEKFG